MRIAALLLVVFLVSVVCGNAVKRSDGTYEVQCGIEDDRPAKLRDSSFKLRMTREWTTQGDIMFFLEYVDDDDLIRDRFPQFEIIPSVGDMVITGAGREFIVSRRRFVRENDSDRIIVRLEVKK